MERRRPRAPRLLSSTHAIYAVAFSPAGGLLATGDSHGEVRLLDVADPAHPRLLGVPLASSTQAPIYAMAFGSDGRTLASIDYEGTRSGCGMSQIPRTRT